MAYNGVMPLQVDAVYQKGVLRPLQPLHLPENERVIVTVRPVEAAAYGQVDTEYVQALRRKLERSEPAPGLEDVRRRLSKIPGSMAADFAAEREDR
jgi:predicted DNA-binding antitoxin AbrB/MazE fold protein